MSELVLIPNAARKPNAREPRKGEVEEYLTSTRGIPLAVRASNEELLDALLGIGGATRPVPLSEADVEVYDEFPTSGVEPR